MPRARAPSFSSPIYWSERFARESSFEWLLPGPVLIPTVVNAFTELAAISLPQQGGENDDPVSQEDTCCHILHFGCGTSSLGLELAPHLQSALDHQIRAGSSQTASRRWTEIALIDADYVASSLAPRSPESPSHSHPAGRPFPALFGSLSPRWRVEPVG
jgi:hypothetical protein